MNSNVKSNFLSAQNSFIACLWEDAIRYFKQSLRVDALSADEVWYAYYITAKSWKELGNDLKMESWVNKAFQMNKTRAEPLCLACTRFRDKGEHFKAYHYYRLGKSVSRPTEEAYRVETDVYDYKLDYENTILHYWIYSSDTDRIKGLISLIQYLNKSEYCAHNVLSNMDYYVPRLGNYGTIRKLQCDETVDHYTPSSASILELNGRHLVNVRYVNYRIQPNGGYMMYDNGTYNSANNIKTRNAAMYLDDLSNLTNSAFFSLDLADVPKLDCGIRGIEDVRLFLFQGKVMYTATTREYSYKQDTNRIIIGTYDHASMAFRQNRILYPPTETVCEKNWIPINHCDEKVLFVYGWHPLQIGEINDNGRLHISIQHTTPSFWKHYRGSSTFISHNDQLWCITHGVKEGSSGRLRRYYHQFVALDRHTYAPLRYSVPFYFMEYTIEYCIGLAKAGDDFMCIFSRMDCNPHVLTIRTDAIEQLMVTPVIPNGVCL